MGTKRPVPRGGGTSSPASASAHRHDEGVFCRRVRIALVEGVRRRVMTAGLDKTAKSHYIATVVRTGFRPIRNRGSHHTKRGTIFRSDVPPGGE